MINGLRLLGKYEGQPGVGPIVNVDQVLEESPLLWVKDQEGKNEMERRGYWNISEEEYNKFKEEHDTGSVAGDVTGDGKYTEEDQGWISQENDRLRAAREAYEGK